MGLIKKSNDGIVDFHEHREQKYYDKFIYKARFECSGVSFLRYATSIIEWETRVKGSTFFSWLKWKQDHPSNHWEKLENEVKQEMLSNKDIIENIMKFINSYKKNKEISCRIESNTIAFFFNDIAMLSKIKALSPRIHIESTKVILDEFAGVKYFVNPPKHNFRVYLKSKRIDAALVASLNAFLISKPDMKPSRATSKWLTSDISNWRKRYCSTAYYIDYTQESDLSYLALCYGEILGRKYKLDQRKI